jgi:hypothetical protein
MKTEVWIEILKKGILAPSADNLQPWKFRRAGDCLELWLDAERASHFSDTQDAMPQVSAGAVIANIRIAAAHFGYQLKVDYLPGRPAEPFGRLAALLYFQPQTAKGHPLFHALDMRVTNRKPFDSNATVSARILTQFEEMAEEEGGRFLWMSRTDAPYKKMSRALAEADQLRFSVPALRREFSSSLRKSGSKDGLTLESLEGGLLGSTLLKLFRNEKAAQFLQLLGVTQLVRTHTQKLTNASAGLGLILMKGSEPIHYMKGGEVMERIWLAASLKSLAFHPMQALPIFILNSV